MGVLKNHGNLIKNRIMKKQDIYNKVKEVESHIKATAYQIQITSGKYDLLKDSQIVFRGNIFKLDEYCIDNRIYDCRYEDVKKIYKRTKQENGLWTDWVQVYSFPDIFAHEPSGLKFYPNTRNYTIDLSNGKEIYYIEY